MPIPKQLEYREVDKKLDTRKFLVVILFVGSLFIVGIGGMIGFVINQPNNSKTKDIQLIGLLAAYNCQIEKGRISKENGLKLLKRIMIKNQLPLGRINKPRFRDAAYKLSQRLDDNCNAIGFREDKFINKLLSK